MFMASEQGLRGVSILISWNIAQPWSLANLKAGFVCLSESQMDRISPCWQSIAGSGIEWSR